MKHKKLLSWLLIGYLAAFFFLPLPAQAAQTDESAKQILVLDMEGPLTPVLVSYLERGIDVARDSQIKLIVIKLNTPGGSISLMNEIIQLIRGSEIPIAVYVTPRGAMAGSAGTLITLAGHVNAMAPETTIGAASPVGAQGEDIGETMAAKEKEILRATARSLAEKRSPEAIELAEQAIESARAASASEAYEIGLVDIVAEDLGDLLDQLEGRTVIVLNQEMVLETRGAVVRDLQLTLVEQALQLLTNPNIVFLLLSIGVQAILIELSSPGGWVAGFIGVICLALVIYSFGILPINLFGLIFIIIAFALFILDIKAPTHGALTAAGIGTFIAGALILFNSVRVPGFPTVSVPLVIGTGVILAISFSVIISFAIRALRIPAKMGKQSLIGKTGIVRERLEPAGSVQVFGELWSAELAEGEEMIPEGAQIEVVEIDGLRLKVRRKK